jgi:low affinity Fe/Cu permease
MLRDGSATGGGLFGEKVRMRAEQYLNPDRRSDSRVLHALESCLSHPAVALSIVGADVVWVVFSTVVGFPSRLETIFQMLVAAVTLAMVLIIQHTQSRQQEVTQRKLDELLNAVPHTDEAMIGLEAGSDEDLQRVRRMHRDFRAARPTDQEKR